MSYVNKCKNINLQSCVELQECFGYKIKGKTVYTPYELVDDVDSFFQQAVVGELGTLLNYYCKTKKKKAFYSAEVLDEAADIFIYFLTHVMLLSNKKKLLAIIEKAWDKENKQLSSDSELNKSITELINNVFAFNLKTSEDLVLKIFNNIVLIGCFTTGNTWQEIIDQFHFVVLNNHLDPKKYALNFRYIGSGYIDFGRLLKWIEVETKNDNLNVAPNIIKIFEKFEETSSRLKMIDF